MVVYPTHIEWCGKDSNENLSWEAQQKAVTAGHYIETHYFWMATLKWVLRKMI